MESIDFGGDDVSLEMFSGVLSKFRAREEPVNVKIEEGALETAETKSSMTISELHKEDKKKTARQIRRANRLSVAQLKQMVSRPDVVEAEDVTSSNPHLLVYLKSMRNTVPVPRHWSRKKRYLQGKLGSEKKPWELEKSKCLHSNSFPPSRSSSITDG